MPRLDANGNTEESIILGPFTYHLSDDFGGGTAILQFEDTDGTWIDIANSSTTTLVDKLYDQPPSSRRKYRINLSGSTTPDLLYAFNGDIVQY